MLHDAEIIGIRLEKHKAHSDLRLDTIGEDQIRRSIILSNVRYLESTNFQMQNVILGVDVMEGSKAVAFLAKNHERFEIDASGVAYWTDKIVTEGLKVVVVDASIGFELVSICGDCRT